MTEGSLRQTKLALSHAIRFCPQDAPLYAALQGLLCPLAAAADREQADAEDLWHQSLKLVIDFADDVVGLLPSTRLTRQDEEHDLRLEQLNNDAAMLHKDLDSRGLFAAFGPTFAQQRLWDRIVRCFSQAPGDGLVRDPLLSRDGIRYEVIFRSLDTYFSCIEKLLAAEKKVHHLAQALIGFVESVERSNVKKIGPSADIQCPEIDITRFKNICERLREFESGVRRTSISQNDALQIKELFTQLRLTGFNFKGNLDFDLTNSSIRFPTILGATSISVVYPAVLHAKDDVENAGWDMGIAIKVFIPTQYMLTREHYFRCESLRLQTLTHPCVLTVHDTFWPESKDGRVQSDVLVISELMSHSIQSARNLRLFRSPVARVRLLMDVAQGLKYLHQSGVGYHALRPSNVLVRVHDGRWHGRAKIDITNLLSKVIFEDRSGDTTINKLLYASPETLSGNGKFFTGDVWSLGMLACFLFAPTRPGEVGVKGLVVMGDSPEELVIKLARDWCQKIEDVNVRRMVIECLHRRPEERPTAARVVDSLQTLLDHVMSQADGEEEIEDEIIAEGQPEENVDDVILDSSRGVVSVSGGDKLISHQRDGTRRTSNEQPDITVIDERGNSQHKRKGLHEFAPTPKRRRRLEGSPEDPDWDASGHDAEEIHVANASSGSESEVTIKRPKRQPSRRAKERNSNLGNLPDVVELEPGPSVANVETVESIDDKIPSKQLAKRDRSPSASRPEIYIPSDTRAPHASGLPARGGDGGAVVTLPTNDGEASNLKAQSNDADEESVDDNELYVGPERSQNDVTRLQSGFVEMSEDLAKRLRVEYAVEVETFEELNDVAESVQESGTVGCVERAAKLFFIAAEGGNVKAQVNYGMCLENGRGVEQDFCVAAIYFQNAANQGDSKAQLKIGLYHELGKGTKKDFRMAAEWYQKSAEQGHPQAQANLGMAYQYGRGVKKDPSKAAMLYNRAAAAENDIAQLNLGVMYENGISVEKDLKKAVELYKKSSNNGNKRAMLNLALCYEHGHGVEKSMANAAVKFIQAAEAGNGQAMFRAAQCYHKGEGVKQNITKAAHYYQRATRVENHTGSYYVLATFYENGTGVIRSAEKAFQLYKEAASRKHASALFKVAECYKRGIGVKHSPLLAVQSYKQAAALGSPNAKLSLGYMYENGEGVKKSPENAVKLYREAAGAGLAQAEWALGQCHYFGYGMAKNLRAALKLYESACEKGDPGACMDMALLYKEGTDVPLNWEKAFELCERAARKGNAEGMVNCGEALFYGKGVAQNYEKAVSYFRQAAHKNDPEGYRWLGDCFADGLGVEADAKKAAEYFRLGAEIKTARSANAECCLGECYEKGLGVEVNGQKALTYYKRSANRQNPTAMNNLGIMYENGILVKQDYATAFRYYDKAVYYGLTDAFCNLADCYASGNGVKKDVVKAADLYRQGAEHDLPEAQCELGVCLYYGRGVAQDRVKGVEYLKKAAESEPEAQRHLGIALYDGIAVQQDFNKAYELISKAADAGNLDAVFNLGLMYQKGYGVQQDYVKAAELFRKAADEGGNKTAMRALGSLYFSGLGVEQDDDEALRWFEKSPMTEEELSDTRV